MKISELTIHDFRCFERLRVVLDPNVNVFVGNNGAGKSAVLDAISAALFPYVLNLGFMSGSRQREEPIVMDTDFRVHAGSVAQEPWFEVRTKGGPDWSMEYRLPQKRGARLDAGRSGALKPLEDFVDKLAADADRQGGVSIPVVAYYGGSRNVSGLADVKTISNRRTSRFDSFLHALNAGANYDEVAKWFFFREVEELREGKIKEDVNYELPDLAEVRRAISTVLKPAAKVFFRQGAAAALMVKWDGEDGQTTELRLSQLSNGHRNMLALVMDFARRMAQANPNLKNPLEGPGILMIDEIELHLHPTWQQRIIPDLRKAFPQTQLIVTTHSPEVVTTVSRGQVHVLQNYEVLPCPNPTYGAKTSDVVRSVLGLEELRPDNEVSRNIALLFQAIDGGDLPEAKTIRENLRRWDSEGYDPDLTRADMRMRRLEQKGAH